LYPSGIVAAGMGQLVSPPGPPSGKREVTTAPEVGGTKRLGEATQETAAPLLHPKVKPVIFELPRAVPVHPWPAQDVNTALPGVVHTTPLLYHTHAVPLFC
jgi:hypothetical protein